MLNVFDLSQGITIIPEQQQPVPRKARGKNVTIERDFALRRR